MMPSKRSRGLNVGHRSGETFAGRVITAYDHDPGTGINGQSIQLDREFTFDTGLNYWITYENPSGEGVVTRSLTGFGLAANLSIVQVNDAALDGPVADLPVTDAMYVIHASTSKFRLFRVIANKEQKGYQYQITAVEHAPAKFDVIDQATPLVAPGGTPYGSWPIGAVQNLTASDHTYVSGGNPRVDVTLGWSPPPSPNPADAPGAIDARVTGYQIWWNGGGTGWVLLSTTSSTSFTVLDVPVGRYQFNVRAYTPTGFGPFTTVTDNSVDGNLPTPDMPNSLTVNDRYNDMTIFWDQVTTTGTAGYYVYIDGVLHFTITSVTQTSYQYNFVDINTHRYSVAAYNAHHPPVAGPVAFVDVRPVVPPDPTGFAIRNISTTWVDFQWTAAPPTGCSYEIRSGVAWVGGTPQAAGITGSSYRLNFPSPGGVVFWCRTKSNIGLYSLTAIPTSGPSQFFYSPFIAIFVTRPHHRDTHKSFLCNANVVPQFSAAGNAVSVLAAVTAVSSLSRLRGVGRVANVSLVAYRQFSTASHHLVITRPTMIFRGTKRLMGAAWVNVVSHIQTSTAHHGLGRVLPIVIFSRGRPWNILATISATSSIDLGPGKSLMSNVSVISLFSRVITLYRSILANATIASLISTASSFPSASLAEATVVSSLSTIAATLSSFVADAAVSSRVAMQTTLTSAGQVLGTVVSLLVKACNHIKVLSLVQVSDGRAVVDLPVTNTMFVISSSTYKFGVFREGYRYPGVRFLGLFSLYVRKKSPPRRNMEGNIWTKEHQEHNALRERTHSLFLPLSTGSTGP